MTLFQTTASESMFVEVVVECDAAVAGGPHSYSSAPQKGLSNGLKGAALGADTDHCIGGELLVLCCRGRASTNQSFPLNVKGSRRLL